MAKKPQRTAFCSSCKQTIGVALDFHMRSRTAPRPPAWRMSKHHRPDKTWCPNSRVEVPVEEVKLAAA